MHFYTKTENGVQPRHFVPMAKDPSKTRASRVTDARKAKKEGEIWYPSVTSVLGIFDKPGLNVWKENIFLEYAFQVDKTNMEMGSWIDAVRAKAQERFEEAPQAGTDIHDVLEKYIRDGIEPECDSERDICRNVEGKLLEMCGEQDWRCEEYFYSGGYAGCADLVSDEWVIDYKSKQEASKFKPGKMAYPEHAQQLAAYSEGFGGGRKCANIFICLETGEVDFHLHSEEEIKRGWKVFSHALEIFKVLKYDAEA